MAVHDVGADPPQQARQPEEGDDFLGDPRAREQDVDAGGVAGNAEGVELRRDAAVARRNDRRDLVPLKQTPVLYRGARR